MKKSTKKSIYHQLHLWLGLISGLVVLVVALTGCLWVFQKEITTLVEGERKVIPQEKPFITALEAKETALTVFPDKHIHGTAFGKTDEPVEVIFYEADPEFYQSVYLNPYSGEVMEVKNHREGFFWFVLRGHLYLWLPKAIGTEITSYGTMIFVVMLITGIILWWPKKKKGRKQRFRFVWKPSTRWRRKNFDLHSILGFYISVVALVIAFSGLIMAFNWIYYVTYLAWGGDKDPRFVIPNTAVEQTIDKEMVINSLVPQIMEEVPEYSSIELHYPTSDSASVYIEVATQAGVYYSSDYRFFDQYTGQELESASIYGKYSEASLADKVLRMNYDIHVGAIGGVLGKIIAFIVSLLCASLPVTGFLIWLGRRNKKNDDTPKALNRPKKAPVKRPKPKLKKIAADLQEA
ncbi:PepSY domain-containing protein [Fulvivirga sp. RKSG066]|uniref:PepSY-associated TM helix domain-containing protein n=1 Tax=Fulvivirga aurantia TaxID=2529383 RepID=UPI0012BB4FC9|nr:PepSY-associated TM helix domain-containing protein [Fulvivirga aurantia]MTI19908.1 PepSY domain-containing protein [Fulvivirga aurantia]